MTTIIKTATSTYEVRDSNGAHCGFVTKPNTTRWWRAAVRVAGQTIVLGLYPTRREAADALVAKYGERNS